jgi:hypothetical protein
MVIDHMKDRQRAFEGDEDSLKVQLSQAYPWLEGVTHLSLLGMVGYLDNHQGYSVAVDGVDSGNLLQPNPAPEYEPEPEEQPNDREVLPEGLRDLWLPEEDTAGWNDEDE